MSRLCWKLQTISLPPHHHYIEGASSNMFANVEKLIAYAFKSRGKLAQRPTKICKTFPVHEQMACAVYHWVTPERIFTPPKIFF